MQDGDLALGLQSKNSKHKVKQTFTFHQTPQGLESRVTLGQAKEHLVLWTIESYSLGQTSESRITILSLPWKESMCGGGVSISQT